MLVASASRPSASAASRVCPVLRGRLDQLGQRPHRDMQLSSPAQRLAPRPGPLVAAEPVVQDGGYPLRPLDGQALARSLGRRDDGLDQRGGLGLGPPETGEQHGPEGGVAAPRRRRDRLPLGDQRSSRREIAMPDREDRSSSSHRPRAGPASPPRGRTGARGLRSHASTPPPTPSPRRPRPSSSIAAAPPWRSLLRRRPCAARLSRGAAWARPSVTSTASPSSSRSDGRGAPAGGGADRAARETSCRSPAPANCPANSAAYNASR